MKPFLLACVAVAAISVGAFFGLHAIGFSASDVASGSAVRLD